MQPYHDRRYAVVDFEHDHVDFENRDAVFVFNQNAEYYFFPYEDFYLMHFGEYGVAVRR